MKRLVATVLLATFSALAWMTPAFAQQSNCTITNTGNGSVTVCEVNDSTELVAFCTNNATIDTTTVQNGTSGTANVTGNTTGGTASSGSVSNTTLTQVAAQLQCAPAAQQTVTPPATTTPPTSSGQGAGVATPAAPVVKSLPSTGKTSPLEYTLGATALASGLLLAIAVVARLRHLA